MAKKRGLRSRLKVKLELSDIHRLRSRGEDVLREIDPAISAATRQVLDQALTLVPRGGAPEDPVNLADTAFVSGPVHNLTTRLSTTGSAGFEHSAAGPIHEGFHWGEQTQNPPPHFLRNAAKTGVRSTLKKGVAKGLMRALQKFFR